MARETVIAVATSGGRDSIALLHATMRSAHARGVRIVALHVHHGLMPEADRWAEGLRARCEAWAAEGRPVSFAMTCLRGTPATGDSVEAWARRERYAALARMAHEHGASAVLLAHHQSDQAETVLLQALRGAGPAGLAGMPSRIERDGMVWLRPWLEVTSGEIDNYVGVHALEFVHDPSNEDPRFARSRLRATVMPALRDAFIGTDTSLALVARQANEAREVLAEVADEDLLRLGAEAELPLVPWRALSAARRANALRHWLASIVSTPVPDTLVRRLMVEMEDDGVRRWPLDATRYLRSSRGRLAVVEWTQFPTPSLVAPADARLSLLRCDEHTVDGWPGWLQVFPTRRQGIAPERLSQVLARPRSGGEQFQRARAGLARSLKKQYQAAGVPSDGRDGPLLFDADGALLFAPGLGIDARAWAEDGAPQWGIAWVPAPVTKAEPV